MTETVLRAGLSFIFLFSAAGEAFLNRPPVHVFPERHDEKGVSCFLTHAREIFDVALTGGPADCEYTILVARDGAILVVERPGWELEALRLEHGAAEAYRVRRRGGQVHLEGRTASGSCRMEEEKAALPCGRQPVAEFPRYLTLV